MVWTGTNLMMRILFRFLCLIIMRCFREARASDLTRHDERAHKVFSSLLCSCARVRARKKE